jgi:hypothetical protein
MVSTPPLRHHLSRYRVGWLTAVVLLTLTACSSTKPTLGVGAIREGECLVWGYLDPAIIMVELDGDKIVTYQTRIHPGLWGRIFGNNHSVCLINESSGKVHSLAVPAGIPDEQFKTKTWEDKEFSLVVPSGKYRLEVKPQLGSRAIVHHVYCLNDAEAAIYIGDLAIEIFESKLAGQTVYPRKDRAAEMLVEADQPVNLSHILCHDRFSTRAVEFQNSHSQFTGRAVNKSCKTGWCQ